MQAIIEVERWQIVGSETGQVNWIKLNRTMPATKEIVIIGIGRIGLRAKGITRPRRLEMPEEHTSDIRWIGIRHHGRVQVGKLTPKLHQRLGSSAGCEYVHPARTLLNPEKAITEPKFLWPSGNAGKDKILGATPKGRRWRWIERRELK